MPDLMFFLDEDETPRSPDQIEIADVQVRPLPDGRRIGVQVTLTPFVQNPAFDVTILHADGTVERSLSVVGAPERTSTLTMHLGPHPSPGPYVLRVELYHGEAVLQTRDVPFTMPDLTDDPPTQT